MKPVTDTARCRRFACELQGLGQLESGNLPSCSSNRIESNNEAGSQVRCFMDESDSQEALQSADRH